MTLLRREMGAVLRRHRECQRRTLRDVASRAGVSLGYLSEVERGVKEASSELLDAICRSLALDIPDLLVEVAGALARAEAATRADAAAAARSVTQSAAAASATPVVLPPRAPDAANQDVRAAAA